jgi:WD40 repeat protein
VGALPSGTLELYDVSEEKAVTQFSGEMSRVSCITRSADGGVVATLDSKETLRFWLVESKFCVLERRMGVGLKSILFSGNGRFLGGMTEQGSLLIWELEWQLDPAKPRIKKVDEEPVAPVLSLWQKLKKKLGF